MAINNNIKFDKAVPEFIDKRDVSDEEIAHDQRKVAEAKTSVADAEKALAEAGIDKVVNAKQGIDRLSRQLQSADLKTNLDYLALKDVVTGDIKKLPSDDAARAVLNALFGGAFGTPEKPASDRKAAETVCRKVVSFNDETWAAFNATLETKKAEYPALVKAIQSWRETAKGFIHRLEEARTSLAEAKQAYVEEFGRNPDADDLYALTNKLSGLQRSLEIAQSNLASWQAELEQDEAQLGAVRTETQGDAERITAQRDALCEQHELTPEQAASYTEKLAALEGERHAAAVMRRNLQEQIEQSVRGFNRVLVKESLPEPAENQVKGAFSIPGDTGFAFLRKLVIGEDWKQLGDLMLRTPDEEWNKQVGELASMPGRAAVAAELNKIRAAVRDDLGPKLKAATDALTDKENELKAWREKAEAARQINDLSGALGTVKSREPLSGAGGREQVETGQGSSARPIDYVTKEPRLPLKNPAVAALEATPAARQNYITEKGDEALKPQSTVRSTSDRRSGKLSASRQDVSAPSVKFFIPPSNPKGTWQVAFDQALLLVSGVSVGSHGVDGVRGGDTRAGIAAYRQQHGLPAGAGMGSIRGGMIEAFQEKWNAEHPDQPLAVTGQPDEATQRAMMDDLKARRLIR